MKQQSFFTFGIKSTWRRFDSLSDWIITEHSSDSCLIHRDECFGAECIFVLWPSWNTVCMCARARACVPLSFRKRAEKFYAILKKRRSSDSRTRADFEIAFSFSRCSIHFLFWSYRLITYVKDMYSILHDESRNWWILRLRWLIRSH